MQGFSKNDWRLQLITKSYTRKNNIKNSELYLLFTMFIMNKKVLLQVLISKPPPFYKIIRKKISNVDINLLVLNYE